MKRDGERGFTLIEITAVLFLIAISGLVVVPAVIKSVEKGRARAAVSQIRSLKNVMNQYKLENGGYPTTEQGLAALSEKPTVPPIPETWDGPYVEDPVKNDPWNRTLNYRSPGQHNTHGYDLYSYGADGVEGGTGVDADITNW